MQGFSEWRTNVQPLATDAPQETAILVTFFGGDRYYKKCAERLAAQCEAWQVPYSIWEYEPDSDEGWRNICRKKIRFYTSLLSKFRRPVLWMDVDSEIIGDPSPLLKSRADFAGFLRNFKYLVGFDPFGFSRLFHPGYIFINASAVGLEFASHLLQTDGVADETGTDDYVLQEALSTFPGELQIELFAPRHIVTSSESEGRDAACVQHADSGNVSASQQAAAQHLPTALSVPRQKQVLFLAANEAARAGRRSEAGVFLKRIRALDPNDTEALRRLLDVYDRLGEDKKYQYHYNSAKKNPSTRATAMLHELSRRLARGRFDSAETLAGEISAKCSQKDAATVKSLMFRGSLDRRASELQISDDERVHAWWWERPHPGNLGDIINPYVIEKLTGVPPKFSAASPRVLAIGSIIKFAKQGDHVWGAGAPSKDTAINPGATFHAVRGPLTRQIVVDAGGDCPEIYGDPAWLLPTIYRPKVPKKFAVGVIRHFTHRDVPLTLGEGVREIDILRVGYDEIEAFLTEMLECESIVSTSLHGVIIANAYGIPCKHAVISRSARQIHGDGIKFKDYFLSIGRADIEPWDLSDGGRVLAEDKIRCTDNPAYPIDVEKLLRSAPFTVTARSGVGTTLAGWFNRLSGRGG